MVDIITHNTAFVSAIGDTLGRIDNKEDTVRIAIATRSGLVQTIEGQRHVHANRCATLIMAET